MIKNNYQLRPMQAADLSAVLLIEQEQAFPWTQRMLQDCLSAHYECQVIEIKQEIIGFAVLAVGPGQAEVLNIVIKTTYQRQGLGEILLLHLIDRAKQQGVEEIILEVRASNTAALSLYKKLHFMHIGMRKNYYCALNGREDACVMRLTLGLQ